MGKGIGKAGLSAMASLAVAFGVAALWLLKETLPLSFGSSGNPLADIPIPFQSAIVSPKTASDAVNAEGGTLRIGSEPSTPEAMQPFHWPEDAELIGTALRHFKERKDWDASLYLSSLLKDGSVTQEELNSLIANSCLEHLSKALESEAKEMRKAGFQGSPEGSSGMAASLALLANARVRLKNEAVPDRVAYIMSFVLMDCIVKGSFARRLAIGMLAGPSGDVLHGWKDGGVWALESCMKSDPASAGEYVRSCFDDFIGAAGRNGEQGRRWISLAGGTIEQREALGRLMKGGDLTPKIWRELPKSVRWSVARRAAISVSPSERGAIERAFNESLQGIEWRDALAEDASANARVMAWLRSCPPWTAELNRLDYTGAWDAISRMHKDFIGGAVEPDVEARIRRTLDVERRLWKELVSGKEWDAAMSKEGELPGGTVSTARFMMAYSSIFPDCTRRFSKDSALYAACMVNRGEDTRYMHIKMNASINELAEALPGEEFGNGKGGN